MNNSGRLLLTILFRFSEATTIKKVFLKILQYSQENTCVRVSFLKKVADRPVTLLEKKL